VPFLQSAVSAAGVALAFLLHLGGAMQQRLAAGVIGAWRRSRAARVALAAVAVALLLALAAALTRRPAAPPPGAAPDTLARLRDEHMVLHDRLAKEVADDPLARLVLREAHDVVIAVRPAFVSALVAAIAQVYLSAVDVDLTAIRATADGELHGDTPLGRVKAGEWRVAVVIESLRGRLAAGEPRLRFSDGRIDVELPVLVRPARGTIAVDFSWDSSGLVNVVCRDFRLDRELEGRVVEQRHVLVGAVELSRRDSEVSALPVFERPSVPVRVDLTDASWSVVEQALRSQDSFGRCGLLLKPEEVVESLHELAGRGIAIRLPPELFQPARLPAQVEHEVRMGGRALALSVRGEAMRVTPQLLWSAASVSVAQAAGAAE
jgi:hypothetical protein